MGRAAVKDAPVKSPVSKTPARAAKASDQIFDDLSSIASENKAYEEAERAKTGNQNSFITLVQANSGVLERTDPAYIPGAKPHDYVISSKKLVLGDTLDATILGMFKLYSESPKKEGEEIPPTVGFWMPEDAMQVPLAPGAIFDREFTAADGKTHVLQPVHWVFLYLHDFPDITDGLLTFRSVGNRVFSALEKMVKSESTLCTQLRFEISNQGIRNDTYKKTYYYPQFTLARRNFEYNDGRIVPVKDGLDGEELREVLTRSNAIQKAYAEMKLIAKRNIPALLEGGGRKSLPAGRGAYAEDAAAEASVKF